uniref:Tetratricopeptide repeat domain 38 n=1 Tax=Gasterosteus aculeatus aculeatus TaxID=481459 RepID=A0AAQ4NZ04_GASAC
MLASSFRDCKAWSAEGLPLSTSSNEACKLYDAILTQYVKWQNDENVGGFEGSISAIQAADPNFVMGHVISTGLELVSTVSSTRLNQRLAGAVRRTVELADSQALSSRERLHVVLFPHGAACDVWEDILVDHPTDMLALKFSHDGYFYTGAKAQLRDSVARVLPYWKPHMPFFSFLVQGLAMTPKDAWSVHSVAHVYEMKAEVDKGLKFMESREKDWQVHILCCYSYAKVNSKRLSCVQVIRRCKATGSMLDTVDASSMLCRLQMEGVCVKDRWQEVLQVTRPHTDDHVTLFNDVHFLMASLGAKDGGTSRRLLEGLQELAKEPGDNQQHHLAASLGVSMVEAMTEYDQGNYNRTVELLYPLRYRLVEMGGSDAQRDVFNRLLIHAAIKSENKHHQKMGR